MTSVRRRLLAGTAAATVAVFLIAAVSLYFLARHFLLAELDAGVRAKARVIASMIDLHDTGPQLEADDAQRLPEFQPGKDPQYFEVVTEDGRRVLASASLEDERLGAAPASRPAAGARFIQLPGGRRGRAVTVLARAQVEGGDKALAPQLPRVIGITVAKSTVELDKLLGLLRAIFAAVCGVGTVALLAITAWLIRRGLRPLDRLARGIGDIGAADLGARLDLANVPAELTPVVSRLNELLGRLQDAFEREKCFTADAAHELRTPLSGLEAALEVCASRRRDTQRYEQVVRDCLKVARRMRGTIENLLMLARADADRVPVDRSTVDAGELLEECWANFQQRAEDKHVSVEFQIGDNLLVETDREKLSIILNNILENAASHVDEGGRVQIEAGASAQSVTLGVTNTGSRVRPEDSARVFDRFWRGDGSRPQEGGHSGLGLAVCKKLATALGVQFSVQSTSNGRFIARLDLGPTAPHRAGEVHLEKKLRMA